ncbi:chromatin structure-remodeling complex protein-like protein rsc1 [Phyllosticta citribraziliensis]|uniref:Chromatin structure-remodeling complex protein-like protein rsc1 n=1 Tax=Phyllosticta citribraziliensis TaxID=989973 RepID=A0ABR1L3V1_9PEZI
MATDQAISATPIPTTEDASVPGGESSIPDEKWQAMQEVLTKVYNHRIEEDYDPSKIFHRKINKRQVPDYYEVIKEPMALSIIKHKIHSKEYKDFQEYVRDFTLITYNAQVYNRQDSQAYQDALVVKEFFENELKRLIKEKIIDEEEAKIPYLGEIPTYEDPAPEELEEDEDEEEEEDEEEVDDDDDDDDERPKRRRPGPRSTASILKREGGKDDSKDKAANDADSRKRRGRPPRVDTPMEARIKAIMKAIRKPKNNQGQLMVSHFERVPDKTVMPEYFSEIKNPMAMDILKKKLKRKKYQSVDQFMKDVELMFENAKQYNEDESQIYKDACFLQKETRKAADEEKAKPDTDYVMEDGRIPLPEGILHNGELWKVGDWVHIQNANDLTKPIVAQIYRTWQDSDGGKWVNACWYYRPEQTVHRFDRHFYENEVVKTGQYRDHPIDEVVDRCFVMFFTRYNKGRPRGFPADKEIYVCEARYNEEKHKLNKIKTWASCLPDEVRDKDYEMDLFDVPKKVKKVPSPIQYLLKDDAKETDDLPEPEWGAPNAPPKIGAVHKRPRDPKESPPPEPTPSPPPAQPPPPPQRETSTMSAHAPNGYSNQNNYPVSSSTPVPNPTPQMHHTQPAYTPQPASYHQHSASPAPPMQSLAATHPASFPPQTTPHHPSYGPTPTPHALPTASHLPSSAYAQQMPSTLYLRNQQAAHANTIHHTIPHSPYASTPSAHHVAYKPAQSIECYRLDDHTNATIPPHLRDQFQQDEQGRLLLFTAPPLDVLPPLPDDAEPAPLGHSAQYLAARKKRAAMIAEKRKREEEETPGRVAQEAAAKKARIEQGARDLQHRVIELAGKATVALESHLAEATVADLRALYGDDWKDRLNGDIERMLAAQEKVRKVEEERMARERDWEQREKERVRIEGVGAMLE